MCGRVFRQVDTVDTFETGVNGIEIVGMARVLYGGDNASKERGKKIMQEKEKARNTLSGAGEI